MRKIGLVGLGGIANGVHIPGIRRSKDLELVAICDIKPDLLEKYGKELDIPENRRFSDYRDLIACPDVEVVDVATPNRVHAEIAMAALGAGKPTVCEKPLAMDAAEAERVAAAADAAGLPGSVCFSYRFRAAARFARDIVLRGDIGRVYHVSIQYLQGWGLPSLACPLVWRFVKSETGSGALGDLGSHAADLVAFVTGQACRRVVAHCGTEVKERELLSDRSQKGPVDVDDYANFMATLDSGASACFQITRLAFGRGNYQRMEVYGEKGSLVYMLDENGSGTDTLDICMGEAMRRGSTYSRLAIPERYRVDQMQCIADAIAGKTDGLVATFRDGADNMHIMDAVLRSAETGRWEDVV